MNFKEVFKDKHVLVLGASSGIGLQICKDMLSYNAQVSMHYHLNDLEINSLLEKYPGSDKIGFDVNNEDEVKKSITQIFTKNPIDVFINCVGIISRGFIPLTSKQNFSNVININLIDAFVVLKHVSMAMIKKKQGNILNVSSLAGGVGLRGQAAYSASKAGLDALTRIAAKELAPYNIRVNGIAPGYVNTGVLETPTKQDIEYKNKIPLKRFGTSNEIAHLACFLTSEYSSYINGQTIIIDGGLSINL